MKILKRITIAACVILLILVGVSCKKKDDYVAPEDVSFTSSTTAVEPGTYTLSSEIKPDNAPQDVNYILDGFSMGIQIDDNKLIVSDTVLDGITITVKVVSKYDLQIFDTIQLAIKNPVGTWIDIYTEEDLVKITEDLSANYRLMNDIELTKPWSGVGVAESTEDGVTNVGEGFAGVFNGNGYSITGFSMPESTGFSKAFFNQTEETAVIENLGIMGTVNGANWCSALVGINKGTILNCVTNVNVTGKSAPNSAFVGVNRGTIMNSYALGRVAVGASEAGHGAGFVNSNSGSIISCYAFDENIPYAIGWKSNLDDSITKTEKELREASTYLGWDDKIWYLENDKFPVLRTKDFSEDSDYIITKSVEWIEITNQKELAQIADNLSGNYRLMADIELEGEWKGIGRAESTVNGVKDSGQGFAGKFDGNGFCISGLSILDDNGYNLGFFNQTEATAVIENLSLSGNVQGANWCSALVGINKGLIRNCVTDVRVISKSAPSSAFVGTNRGTISWCYSLGEVITGANEKGHSGGFVNNNTGEIIASFALDTYIDYAIGYQSGIDKNILKSEKEMTSKETYAEWDESIWFIEDGKLPILR